MGHKSKFTFPMPGRSVKQPPTVAVPNSLSKAERILGTGGQNLGSPTGTRDPNRSWETESTGGISISISESSASQSGVLEEEEDGYDRPTYGRALWEEESEALPRRLRGAKGFFSKEVKPKRSAVTLGARSRDALTDDTNSHRPQTSSTVHSHYESDKMPLSISQQTSNSAMAKGLPTKANALLDIDGALYGKVQQPKRKPSKLDFAKLRLRTRREHHADSNGVGPVLGNNYVMKSPSVMSHASHSAVSLTRSPTSPGGSEKTPKPDLITHSQPLETLTRPSRAKVISNASTLHQLYDHYEQMSFRTSEALQEEDEEEEIGGKGHLNQEHLLPRTYEPTVSDVSHEDMISREDMITPLPNSSLRDPNSRWNHSRNTSQASKVTAMRSETPSTLQIRPSSRNDYAASVSSRHTRTSKATPSIMSTMDSDRQQTSVLSLTDSESEEGETTYSGPGSSLRSYDNSFRDDSSVASSQRQRSTSRLSISSHSTNPKGASYAQLNDYLTIPHASPKTKTTRSPSTNTLHSTNSSLSTATRVSLPIHHQEPQPQAARGSVSTVNTLGSVLSPTYSNHTHYSVQEARAVAFTPYASTAEAALSVSMDQMPISLNHAVSQQGRQRGSQNSHTSDQPTPPLSPTSVEFYRKSPDSSRRESTVSKASESQNGRMMAVTKQEEMLLAALRKKRARMRENIIAELEEGRNSPGGTSLESVDDLEQLASAHLKDAERQAAKEVREARARAKQPNNFPMRSTSLVGRGGRSSSNGRIRNHSSGPRRMEASPSASYREPLERAPSRMRASPGPESRPTGKSRHERVLLYLDRPIDSIDVIDEAEPSPDLSEFMDDDLEFPISERRSRTRSKLGNGSYGSPYSGRPRPDSSPMSPKSTSIKNLPKGSPPINEDIDADSIDFDDFPMVGGRPKLSTLKPVPEKGIPRPDSPVSPADGFLAPSTLGHKKGKKSAVRLSAVGQVNSPMPWWGDDD
ncbi:hypothetical protein F4774DRAFT_65393 [Daldinia eschscholtzii]|nr:hypothetical protein F4774DRAFT_65393 [Daldinia eschscholtzii]